MTSEEAIRLMLVLHYDGSGFFGWQIQPERRTVQGVLQAAAARLTQRECTVTGSGRTDRGVHATCQVASLAVPRSWTARAFRKSANAVLPDDIWIQEARRVDDDFHPRYDAVERTYLYRVGLAEEARSPFHRPFCWPVDRPLDRALLDRCAEAIPGRRSFQAFAKAGQPERGTDCHVHGAEWREWDGPGLAFVISADRYLHHMVRYLVGTMVTVASGRRPLDEFLSLLEDGPTEDLWTSPPAPPEGLYLHRVGYPEASIPEPKEHPGPGEARPRPTEPPEPRESPSGDSVASDPGEFHGEAWSGKGLNPRPPTTDTTTSGFAGGAADSSGDTLPKES